MKKSSIASALTALLFSAAAYAGWTRTGDGAEVVFRAVGPAGFKLEGKSGVVGVIDNGKTVSVLVPLKHLETGIAVRDRHMKERYLEVAKFPDARLDVPTSFLKSAVVGVVEGAAKGNLTLHGKSKETTFTYKAICTSLTLCDVEGALSLNMNDFGIETPKYMGITVKPDVAIQVKFSVLQKPDLAPPPTPTGAAPPPTPAPTAKEATKP